jgi:hypothetical protein
MPYSKEERDYILRNEGYDPSRHELSDDGYVSERLGAPEAPATNSLIQQDSVGGNKSSLVGATLKGLAQSALPTLGASAIVGTAMSSAPVAALSTGAKLLLGGGLGLGSGIGLGMLQDGLVPESIKKDYFPNADDVKEHPLATALGGVLGGALIGNPFAGVKSLASTIPAIKSALKNPLYAGAALRDVDKQILLNASVNAGLGGAANTVQQLRSGSEFSFPELAISALGGTVFNEPYKGNPLNKVMGLTPTDPKAVEFQGSIPPRARLAGHETSDYKKLEFKPTEKELVEARKNAVKGIIPEKLPKNRQMVPLSGEEAVAQKLDELGYAKKTDFKPTDTAKAVQKLSPFNDPDATKVSILGAEDAAAFKARQEAFNKQSAAEARANSIKENQALLDAEHSAKLAELDAERLALERENELTARLAAVSAAKQARAILAKEFVPTIGSDNPLINPPEGQPKYSKTFPGSTPNVKPRNLTAAEKDLAFRRGVNLQEDTLLPANVKGLAATDLRQSRINPNLATKDTAVHEVLGHQFVEDLRAASEPSYNKLVSDAESFASARGENVNELVADAVAGAYDKNAVGGFKQWVENLKATYAYKYGGDMSKATDVIALRGETDAPYGSSSKMLSNVNTKIVNKSNEKQNNTEDGGGLLRTGRPDTQGSEGRLTSEFNASNRGEKGRANSIERGSEGLGSEGNNQGQREIARGIDETVGEIRGGALNKREAGTGIEADRTGGTTQEGSIRAGGTREEGSSGARGIKEVESGINRGTIKEGGSESLSGNRSGQIEGTEGRGSGNEGGSARLGRIEALRAGSQGSRESSQGRTYYQGSDIGGSETGRGGSGGSKSSGETIAPSKGATIGEKESLSARLIRYLPKSEIDSVRYDKNIPNASKAADAIHNYYDTKEALSGKLRDTTIHDLRKMMGIKLSQGNVKDYIKGNSVDGTKAYEYALAKKYNEPTDALTPAQEKIYDRIKEASVNALNERNSREGLRHTEANPGYVFESVSQEARKIMATMPNGIEGQKLKNDYIKHWLKVESTIRGAKFNTEKATIKATKDWNELLTSQQAGKDVELSKKFGPIDKAEGHGLPGSMREKNVLTAAQSYFDRYARRLAYHDAFEANPEINKMFFDPTNDNLSASPKIKNLLEDLNGMRSGGKDVVESVSGLVSSFVTGTVSGVRDIASSTLSGAQHQGFLQVPRAIFAGVKGIRKNWNESISAGVNREHIGALEGLDGADGFSSVTILARKAREISNEVQGRTLGEQVARSMAYSQGKFLALENLHNYQTKGKLGSQESKFFDDFGPKDWREKFASGEVSTEEMQRIAGRYVESVQQTYDARDLPRFSTQSSIAPFFQLARWSIGKATNFSKYAIEPALRGNMLPLINQTLYSGLFGGLLVEGINQLMTSYKSNAPTLSEIQKTKELGGDWIKAAGYRAASLAALSGYGGELANLAKMAADASRGNKVNFYNYLAVEAAATARDLIPPLVNAMVARDVDKTLDIIDSLISAQSQTYRVASRLLSDEKQADARQANKNRDLRVFKQNMGMPVPPQQKFKRDYDNYYASEFRGLNTENIGLKDPVDLLTKAVDEIMSSNKDTHDKLSALSNLKRSTQRFMPDFKENPSLAAQYTDYLSDTQGQEKAVDRFNNQRQEKILRQALSQIVPSLQK